MDKLVNKKKGFSTIELIIAMAIMVLVLSAVIVVSFGNQFFLVGSETNREALNKAQELIEQEQAFGRKDFNLVNPMTTVIDNIYSKSVSVKLLSDFLTKEVKATISWKDERQVDRKVELTTLITNFENPSGASTCDSTLSGDWSRPVIENSTTDFATLVGNSSLKYTISDVDAYKGKLYVTANKTTNPTDPTFFIFDISNPLNPTLMGSVDNEGMSGTTTVGLSAVKVSEDPSSNKIYAFTANSFSANYGTPMPPGCNPATTSKCGQLDIFDVSNPYSPKLSTNLAISSTPAISGTTSANSIFYKNGYILLGLKASAGPEFHILDVHNIASLLGGSHFIVPVGSFEVGHDINALNLRGTYAYIAIPNDVTAKELQVLDISNPSAPIPVGGFDMSGGGNGKSLYLVGNRLYFGNTVPNSGNDFHVLDNTNPNSTLKELGGVSLPSSLNAIIVRNNLAFLLTNTDLEIFDIGDPESTNPITLGNSLATLSIATSANTTEPSMDCEGNYMYITSNNSAGQGSLYIVTAGS